MTPRKAMAVRQQGARSTLPRLIDKHVSDEVWYDVDHAVSDNNTDLLEDQSVDVENVVGRTIARRLRWEG